MPQVNAQMPPKCGDVKIPKHFRILWILFLAFIYTIFITVIGIMLMIVFLPLGLLAWIGMMAILLLCVGIGLDEAVKQ